MRADAALAVHKQPRARRRQADDRRAHPKAVGAPHREAPEGRAVGERAARAVLRQPEVNSDRCARRRRRVRLVRAEAAPLTTTVGAGRGRPAQEGARPLVRLMAAAVAMQLSSVIKRKAYYRTDVISSPRKADFRGGRRGASRARASASAAWHRVGTGDADSAASVRARCGPSYIHRRRGQLDQPRAHSLAPRTRPLGLPVAPLDPPPAPTPLESLCRRVLEDRRSAAHFMLELDQHVAHAGGVRVGLLLPGRRAAHRLP